MDSLPETSPKIYLLPARNQRTEAKKTAHRGCLQVPSTGPLPSWMTKDPPALTLDSTPSDRTWSPNLPPWTSPFLQPPSTWRQAATLPFPSLSHSRYLEHPGLPLSSLSWPSRCHHKTSMGCFCLGPPSTPSIVSWAFAPLKLIKTRQTVDNECLPPAPANFLMGRGRTTCRICFKVIPNSSSADLHPHLPRCLDALADLKSTWGRTRRNGRSSVRIATVGSPLRYRTSKNRQPTMYIFSSGKLKTAPGHPQQHAEEGDIKGRGDDGSNRFFSRCFAERLESCCRPREWSEAGSFHRWRHRRFIAASQTTHR